MNLAIRNTKSCNSWCNSTLFTAAIVAEFAECEVAVQLPGESHWLSHISQDWFLSVTRASQPVSDIN